MTDDFEGKTLINILIGVVVTLVVSAIPAVQAISPAVGGGVAGYLQKRGVGGGIKVGLGVTFVFMIPAILVIIVFSGFIAAFVPFVGAGMLAGTFLFVILLIVFFWTLVLAIVGGVVGGMVAGESEETDEAVKIKTETDTQSEDTTPNPDTDDGSDETDAD